MKDMLQKLVESTPSRVLSQRIKAKYPTLYEWILIESNTLFEVTFKERIWYILNDKPEVKCSLGEKKTFNPKTTSYGFCNNVAKCECMRVHLSETYTPRDMNIVVEKRKNTWLKKYGVENPSQSPDIQAKRQATIQSRDYSITQKLVAYNKETVGYEQVIARTASHVTPLFTREQYNGSRYHNVYEWKCNECEKVFSDHVDYGSFPKCPTCYPRQKWSIGENEIAAYVNYCEAKAYAASCFSDTN